LLLESPVKLPFLNVELPLLGFFVFGPVLFVIVHAYTLLHFRLLADKVGAFNTELREQIADEDTRTRLRRQLPSNIFVQLLSGLEDIRRGAVGALLSWIAHISLVLGPIGLLVFFQLQFLPYHDWLVSWWQRLLVIADLVLLWILWPSIAGVRVSLGWRDLRRGKVAACLAGSLLPILLVFTIATFPGEWLDDHLPTVAFPSLWGTTEKGEVVSLHKLLVAGEIDNARRRPVSLWSNRLVLPGIDLIDHVKFDSDAKLAAVEASISLRGRDLSGAIMSYASLRKADFTGARLERARLNGADLLDAKLGCDYRGSQVVCTDLQGAVFSFAVLRGARLEEAQLQGANFFGTELQGASLNRAHLQGALLALVPLQGASLDGTQLQGAALDGAQLQGASLNGAQLQGASLNGAQLQGAALNGAQLQGASLTRVFVWRSQTSQMNIALAHIDDTIFDPLSGRDFAGLKHVIETSLPPGRRRDGVLKRLDPGELTIDAELNPPASRWKELEARSLSGQEYEKALAAIWETIGCDAVGAPFVISALTSNLSDRFTKHSPHSATLARKFLDEASCFGDRGLSDYWKVQLRSLARTGATE
jgi:uncharacterized protein YjbI with pentapeptide repeats